MSAESDDLIMVALIDQVQKAMSKDKCKNERDVTTIISRPMWRAWNRAVESPEDAEPTEWNPIECHRVYGSKTIVVESDSMAAVSFCEMS